MLEPENRPAEEDPLFLGNELLAADDHGDGIVEVTGTHEKFLVMDDKVVRDAKKNGCKVLLYSSDTGEQLLKIIDHKQVDSTLLERDFKAQGLIVTNKSNYNMAVRISAAQDVDTIVELVRPHSKMPKADDLSEASF